MTTETELTVGFLPWWPANPYQVLLKRELNAAGVRVIGNPPLSLLRILFGRDGLDVVHLHWPHGAYKTWLQLVHLITVLVAYRVLKNNLVWTVHELDAYESRHPRIDAMLRFALIRMCRALIVHGAYTQREIISRFGFPREIMIVRHPSYAGWYLDQIPREQARQRLDIPPNALVFLYFGYVKPYKGVEELIEAFRTVDRSDALLLVVGNPLNDDIRRGIGELASADPRVRLLLEYVPDSEIQLYFRAADIAVFPFRHTQTSGSLMLALGFDRPVVAPEVATIPEYVDGESGIMFDPATTGDLERALRQAAIAPLHEMARAAKSRGEMWSWREMAQRHLDCYRSVRGH